jgi:glycosyltransferase involved in cell wall biosynthesis
MKTPYGSRLEKDGIKTIYMRRFNHYDLTRIIRLAYYYYVNNIDMIISYLHEANVYAFLAKILYLRKTTHIVQVRSRESEMRGIEKALNVLAMRSADQIITNSCKISNFIREYFKQDMDKIIVIPNGTENKHHEEKQNSKRFRFGIVGKDTVEKNIEMFIGTAKKLLNEDLNSEFHLCGKNLGDDSRFLKNIAKGQQASFYFHGEIDDIDEFYRSIDVYLSCSNSEGLPNAVMEAMANGIPVIATDVGGVSEIVRHGETGFIVRPGDADMMLHYCRMLMADPELRTRIGRNGKDYIRDKYSLEKMICNFEIAIDKHCSFAPMQ